MQVLVCFKALHRARKQVFDGDIAALNGDVMMVNYFLLCVYVHMR